VFHDAPLQILFYIKEKKSLDFDEVRLNHKIEFKKMFFPSGYDHKEPLLYMKGH
jgi:hypothetical protein